MENIAEILEGVKTMGIGGHIRPDGDCVGSCMALYLYVKTYYPEIQADVYLDNSNLFSDILTVWMRLKQSWTVTKSMTFLLPVM